MDTRRPFTRVRSVLTPVRFYRRPAARVRPSRVARAARASRSAPRQQRGADRRRFSVIMQKIPPLDIEMV